MNPPSGSNSEPPKRPGNITFLTLSACIINIGSRKFKSNIGTAVMGGVAIAAGHGAFNGAATDATAFAKNFSTSLNAAYSNADTMNQFKG